MRATPIATTSKLAGLGALHVGWGVGSSFPFADRRALADGVAGTTVVPGARECVAGRTGSIVPWDPSAHFTRLDQRYYGPLGLALAAGTLRSIR